MIEYTPQDWPADCGCKFRFDNDGFVRWEKCNVHAAAPELLEACKRAVAIYKDAIDECGGCDHKVGICCCSLIGEGDALLAAISKAEAK